MKKEPKRDGNRFIIGLGGGHRIYDIINTRYVVEGRGKNRTQRLVIYYKFVGYLEIPANLSARNYKADLRQGVAVEYVSCEPTVSAQELFDEDYEPVEEK